MTTTWSLVSTMFGVPEAILPCIAHHLDTDAYYIHVYLDAPLPAIEAALRAHSRCIVTVCDAAYWSHLPDGRPDGLVRRQLANVEHAKKHSKSDWLVHVDSDEFLVSAVPDSPLTLGKTLAAIPKTQDWVRILPMERVLPAGQVPRTVFDGIFRGQSGDNALIKAAYGNGAQFLFRGMSGHVRGKVGFRTKTRLKVRLHDMIKRQLFGRKVPIAIPAENLPPFTELDDIYLLHFEGWTPLQWSAKLFRFAEQERLTGHQKGRCNAVRFMANHADLSDRLGLFDRVQKLQPEGIALLAEAGLLRQAPCNPADLTKTLFPNVPLDFSIAAFDARLRNSAPDFYSRMGFEPPQT